MFKSTNSTRAGRDLLLSPKTRCSCSAPLKKTLSGLVRSVLEVNTSGIRQQVKETVSSLDVSIVCCQASREIKERKAVMARKVHKVVRVSSVREVNKVHVVILDHRDQLALMVSRVTLEKKDSTDHRDPRETKVRNTLLTVLHYFAGGMLPNIVVSCLFIPVSSVYADLLTEFSLKLNSPLLLHGRATWLNTPARFG